MIFLYDQYFLYKPLFPSSQPSKTFKKSSSRYQNLPSKPLTAHSDHWGPASDPVYLQKLSVFDIYGLFDLCSPYVTLS